MKTRFTCHRYFKFQSASPKNIFRAFSVQVPGANELNYSEADLKCLLNKSKVVKQIFLAKLGLLLLLPASYPVLGLTSAAGYASLLGLALVAFDKRATKAIKNAQIAKTVETNQIHLDIQKLIGQLLLGSEAFCLAADREGPRFFRFDMRNSLKDEKSFYSRDEVFDMIQKRYDIQSEVLLNKANLRGTIKGKIIYNHRNDYKIEDLMLAITYPSSLVFTYINKDSK